MDLHFIEVFDSKWFIDYWWLILSITHFITYLDCEKKYSPYTISAYKKDLISFQQFCSEEYELEEISEVSYSLIRSWIVYLVESGISNRSINRKISSLKSYYGFLLKSDQINEDPLRNHQALKGTRGMLEGHPERFNQKDTAFNIAHVGGYGPEVARQRWALQSMDPFSGIYWTLVMGLRHQVDGKVNPEKKNFKDSHEITRSIKRKAKYLGADIVGITTVKEDFIYKESFSYEESKLEEGPAVTTPIHLSHPYVIVLGKEMDYDNVG